MNSIELKPIGIIHSPYRKREEIPKQSSESKAKGEIEVFKEYETGLQDIDGFSHITLLYYFHMSEKAPLLVKPFVDTTLRGVFATRSPDRPNHIGVSVVKLLARNRNILRVEGLDVLDGTPLLDIKPYVPHFDERKSTKIGWLEGKEKNTKIDRKEEISK